MGWRPTQLERKYSHPFWYSSLSSVYPRNKQYNTISNWFAGSIPTNILQATPLKKKKKRKKMKGHWADLQNRKRFLLAFADKIGFDPVVANNWKRQRQNLLKNEVRNSAYTIRSYLFIFALIGWWSLKLLRRVYEVDAKKYLSSTSISCNVW